MTTAVFVAAQHPEIVKPLAGKHYAGSRSLGEGPPEHSSVTTNTLIERWGRLG